MPLFMHVYDAGNGVSIDDVAQAHAPKRRFTGGGDLATRIGACGQSASDTRRRTHGALRTDLLALPSLSSAAALSLQGFSIFPPSMRATRACTLVRESEHVPPPRRAERTAGEAVTSLRADRRDTAAGAVSACLERVSGLAVRRRSQHRLVMCRNPGRHADLTDHGQI
jgi:hypothetical protein